MIDLICIYGTCRLQSELLQKFIKKSNGCDCKIFESVDGIAAACSSSKKVLILWDYKGKVADGLSWLASCSYNGREGQNENLFFVLFNVDPECDQQKQLVLNGVRGIFYDSDPLSVFSKGIGAITKGEMWVSRKHLESCIKYNRQVGNDHLQDDSSLTRREIEVLERMATGATNEEIAEELCISAYTVKTHNYRIFKKIGVSNRMQASLWAINALNTSTRYSTFSSKAGFAVG